MVRAKCWTFGVVNSILKNESVIGTYTPKKVSADRHADLIKDYYPAIIGETKFFQVREHLIGRKWVGGHNNHQVRNLFAGMSYCYKCGGQPAGRMARPTSSARPRMPAGNATSRSSRTTPLSGL
jgi:Recombinase